MATIPCPSPGCPVQLDEDHLQTQGAHLQAAHPEIIQQRLDELHRWDGLGTRLRNCGVLGTLLEDYDEAERQRELDETREHLRADGSAQL
jgi:hypothetical protein